MKDRVFLLAGYWASTILGAGCFIRHGDSSFVPFAILLSWPGFITKLIGPLFRKDGNSPIFYGAGILIEACLFVLYYLGLLVLVSKLTRAKRKGWEFIPGIVHFSGGLAFMLLLHERDILPAGFLNSEPFSWWEALWYIASYIFSISVTLFWLKLDWRSAKGDKQARDSNHNARGE
jgi:hypothetical protein